MEETTAQEKPVEVSEIPGACADFVERLSQTVERACLQDQFTWSPRVSQVELLADVDVFPSDVPGTLVYRARFDVVVHYAAPELDA